MRATNRKLLEQEPDEMELLLPWQATGTLGSRDSRKVEEALARDPDLARQFAVIRGEYAETIHLNESLGAPSARAMQKLFSAIDAEPSPTQRVSPNIAERFTGFFAKLSPQTLAWSEVIGAMALLLQAGVIAVVLTSNRPAAFETASLNTNESVTRDSLPRAMVRFVPDARVSDISALLDKYHASIIEGGKGGLFMQFGDRAMSSDEVGGLLSRLQNEKIVSLAVATR